MLKMFENNIYNYKTTLYCTADRIQQCDDAHFDYKNSSCVQAYYYYILWRSKNGSKSKVITKHKCRLEKKKAVK